MSEENEKQFNKLIIPFCVLTVLYFAWGVFVHIRELEYTKNIKPLVERTIENVVKKECLSNEYYANPSNR